MYPYFQVYKAWLKSSLYHSEVGRTRAMIIHVWQIRKLRWKRSNDLSEMAQAAQDCEWLIQAGTYSSFL